MGDTNPDDRPESARGLPSASAWLEKQRFSFCSCPMGTKGQLRALLLVVTKTQAGRTATISNMAVTVPEWKRLRNVPRRQWLLTAPWLAVVTRPSPPCGSQGVQLAADTLGRSTLLGDHTGRLLFPRVGQAGAGGFGSDRPFGVLAGL